MKNNLLIASYIISMIPPLFNEVKGQIYYLGFYSEFPQTLAWFSYFWSVSINFSILAYCLHYPKGIDKRLTRLILIITILDMFHLMLNGKQGLGMTKIGVAIILLFGYEFYKKKYGKS